MPFSQGASKAKTLSKPRGYPLPDGECYTEDLCPVVICVPNKDEYFQALWGTMHYLATWIAWQRDDDKRGKDAAAAWQFANASTEIGDRMGCLDELQTDVNNILTLLRSKKDCCDSNITYNTQTIIVTTITPGVGDPPDTWGDEAITTWAEWGEYVCYHAHAYVDKLVEHAETLHAATAIGAMGIGTIGAILAGLTFIGLAIPVTWLIAAGIAAAALYFAEDLFEDTATNIQAARQDIVCALLTGGDLAQAVEDALASAGDWDNFFQHVDYATASAIIQEGGDGTEFLESETKDDCADCGYDLLGEEDVYLEKITGEALEYDEVTKIWRGRSAGSAGCANLDIRYWTDATKTVRLHVRIESISCDKDTTCGGADHHRGFELDPGWTEVYGYDHPTLPGIDDDPVQRQYATHTTGNYWYEFRLYAAT